jgi:hypothetical protein
VSAFAGGFFGLLQIRALAQAHETGVGARSLLVVGTCELVVRLHLREKLHFDCLLSNDCFGGGHWQSLSDSHRRLPVCCNQLAK